MTSETINVEGVYISLERVDGSTFEKFFHSFYPDIGGEAFIPQGGTGDGGADAFLGSSLFVGKATGCFYQASIQEDHRDKIRHTIKRLREFGRDPKALIYVTSRRVKCIDVEESELSETLKVVIRIRDATYIAANINYSVGTRAAFNTYLKPPLDFLKNIGESNILGPSKYASNPAIYVFLRQELDHRQEKDKLVNALADGLILWALEGTDPDQRKFLTRGQIIEKIEMAIPSTRKILHGIIPQRLEVLSKIPEGMERPLRWYRKQGYYCLAYEIRKRVEQDNLSDESLRIATLDAFETRLSKNCKVLTPTQRRLAAEVSLAAIHRNFESQGLEFAGFIEGKLQEPSLTVLADHVEKCLLERSVKPDDFEPLREGILLNLQGALHESTPEEGLLFSKLSATYTLLFGLNTEPRLVEYFQGMAADFHLYVGSDILVRALSERYLRPEDQLMRNTLRLIKESGGKLILAEPVLDEVHSHIEATDYAFKNDYEHIELSINQLIAHNIDRIMIRAYFYAKLTPPAEIKSPQKWSWFLNQFCDYNVMHTGIGREQIRAYMLSQFNMEYESRQDIEKLCNLKEVEALSCRLEEEKPDKRLAANDALMAFAVYGRRREKREHSKLSEFGYRTWWLTSESRILKYTGEIVGKNGAFYMMRPEFILKFLTLMPSAAETRHTFRRIFPSLLGTQLARRVSAEELKNILDKIREAQDLEPGRRAAVIAQLSDKLKGDFKKKYEQSFNLFKKG